MAMHTALVVRFSDVDKEDIALVGGKGANLGEMTKAGFPVPDGFIVTSTAYYRFIKENNLSTKIKHLLNTVNFDKSDSLTQVSAHIRKIIIDGSLSDDLAKAVQRAYQRLGGVFTHARVAVRSSATAEDLPEASFAGQQETFLNVEGDAHLLEKLKQAWASLFTARAIFYRNQNKIDHFRVGMAIPVQKMVQSDTSGIMFTIDPLTNDKTKLVIEAIYGLGEMIVQGAVTPDHYEVAKSDLTILDKTIHIQRVLMKKSGRDNKKVKVSSSLGKRQKISDEKIIALAKLGKKLEQHYYFPQDAEWAIEKDKIFIVQTRPVTTTKYKNTKLTISDSQLKKHDLILKGDPASPGIASGHVKIIHKASEIGKVIRGDILVTQQTKPDFVPAMKKAVGIVTEQGGRTSHAAIVSRELGIPAVVGADRATHILRPGSLVTVYGNKGEVYKGGFIDSEKKREKVLEEKTILTATKIYTNLAEPEMAAEVAAKQVDGVGLLRAEFMIAGIGIHPKKVIREGKKQKYIEQLASQIALFAKSFYPRPVVYRTSDFKTNEYHNLAGGKDFEPIEANPMLGYRGAFRYVSDPEVFELELEAIKHVRQKRVLKNLWMMLPFVRTVRELIEVKKIVSANGLYRSDDFKIWMMVEIPSNVILLDKFLYVGIDGVSIGSNDLTMLILGTDRDNSEVAPAFNEQNEAVLWAFEKVIKTAHKHRVTSSICGQAPSLYPSLVEKLVEWGITSISVSPDAIEHTRRVVHYAEKRLLRKFRIPKYESRNNNKI